MLAMEMKTEDRFQNIQDFRMALSLLSAPKPVLEKPKNNAGQQAKSSKGENKKSGSAVFGGCLIAFLIVSIIGIIGTIVILFVLSNTFGSLEIPNQPTSYEIPEPTSNTSSETRKSESTQKTRTWYSYNYYRNNVTEYIDEIYSDSGEREFYYYKSNSSERIYMPVSESQVDGTVNIYTAKLGQNYFRFLIEGNEFRCIDANGEVQYYQLSN
jgi:hypothetical protein